FTSTRSDRRSGTVSYDVKITNRSPVSFLVPLVLVLDPRNNYPGIPAGATGQAPDGRWFIDLSSNLPPGGKLLPGQSTTGRTITISNPELRSVDFDQTISAQTGPKQALAFHPITPPPATGGHSLAPAL